MTRSTTRLDGFFVGRVRPLSTIPEIDSLLPVRQHVGEFAKMRDSCSSADAWAGRAGEPYGTVGLSMHGTIGTPAAMVAAIGPSGGRIVLRGVTR